MKIKSTCLAVLGSSILSYAACASSDTDHTNNIIETITVLIAPLSENAKLGGINLKDLPLNAHVVGQTEIERIRFVEPKELLDRIPGETQVRNLRIPNGGKSYTLAFVDGVPIENPYEGATQRLDRVNTFDIQRVEVIKGVNRTVVYHDHLDLTLKVIDAMGGGATNTAGVGTNLK